MADRIPKGADKARSRRESLGLSQQQLGNLAGLSDETIRNLESGKSIRVGNIVKVLEALDKEERRRAVGPLHDDADGVMLDLPDEVLTGLSDVEREEVIAAARLAALKKAREIRSGAQVGLFTVE